MRRRRTLIATAHSSGTCSSAASTSRRRSSRRCSSRSRTATRRSKGRCRRLPTSTGSSAGRATYDLWETIALEAEAESRLWREALLPDDEREAELAFSPLGEERYALGLETIYEGYLAHYARPRLFAPADDDTALLLGDYLYAHGVVRVAEAGTVEAV